MPCLMNLSNWRKVRVATPTTVQEIAWGPILTIRANARSVILYVDVRTPARKAADTGLQLRILENDDGGPGPIRAALPTELGGILVGLGSEHWHERPRLRAGERLTALTACFSLRP